MVPHEWAMIEMLRLWCPVIKRTTHSICRLPSSTQPSAELCSAGSFMAGERTQKPEPRKTKPPTGETPSQKSSPPEEPPQHSALGKTPGKNAPRPQQTTLRRG